GTIEITSEEEENALQFEGSVDTYFRTNLNSTNLPDNGGTLAPSTSFANLPGFSLGMANLITSYEGDKVGFTTDLVFGPRGVEAVFASPASLNIVNQLYVFWNVSESVKLTFGNFNTFLGYEVISPTGNFNYSTSYMFSYGPFSHTGLKAEFELGKGWSFMGGIFNPTDATDFNPFDSYVGGLQLGYSNDIGSVWLNGIISEGFFQIDLTTGWDVSNQVYLGLNTSLAQDNFFGAAVYVQVSPSDDLALGLRGEYFEDSGIGVLALNESVFDWTLSANYSIGKLTLIPELRLDQLSYNGIMPDAKIPMELQNSLSSFALAAVYSF
ncbi:MAG: outer membrane beta-barrel protein, partial [Chitinophagales bacterium]